MPHIQTNKTKVSDVLANDIPKSWSLLFDERYLNKLKQCGVGLFETPLQLYGAFMLHKAQFLLNNKLISNITNDLIKLKPYYQTIGNEQVASDFKEGKLCIAFAWSSFVNQMGSNLELILPEEGATMYIDTMLIPTKAKNIDNAYKFIDFMLEAENAAELIKTSNGIPAVAELANLVGQEYANNPLIFPDTKTLRRMYLDTPLDYKQEYFLNSEWKRFISK